MSNVSNPTHTPAGEAMRISLYLPAQAAAETEVTIITWRVAEGERFESGQVLAEVDSAKSVFDFEAPCHGTVTRLLHPAGEPFELSEPVLEIETTDESMRDWIPPASARDESLPDASRAGESASDESDGVSAAAWPEAPAAGQPAVAVGLRAVAGYLPERIVTNEELAERFPEVDADYIRQVTGMHTRHWAREDESPLDMAVKVARSALERSGLPVEAVGALIVATATPQWAMPSTACALQAELGLAGRPAFDLNAACSGWLYALEVAKGMILGGTARHVLIVGAERHSGLLDPTDSSTLFLFGDGAGAAIVSALDESGTSTDGSAAEGDHHRDHGIRDVLLWADGSGKDLARRTQPGYLVPEAMQAGLPDLPPLDPWIRLQGSALFRRATEAFTDLIRESLRRSGWQADELRWVIPHQANGRILRAAAKRSGVDPDRFFINLDHVGNTSSASIPLALVEVESQLQPGDKLLLCSVGAGLTGAAVALEW